jgi:chromosome partitioning protein
MAIIALVGNKGGAGKTTLTVNLACALNRIAPTAILDADPQGSSLQWRAIAESDDTPPVFASDRQLDAVLNTRRKQFEHLIIDCPPSVNAMQTNFALQVAELALIPVQPSPLDLWATAHIDHAVEQAKHSNPELKTLLVINQLEPRTTLSRLVRQAIGELGLPAAETAIRRRAIYRAAVLEGKSVFDMGSRGAAAAEELNQLINEVILS